MFAYDEGSVSRIFGAMANNSFGEILRLTTFGESHNASMGGVLDGVPAGVSINIELKQRRKQQKVVRRNNKKEYTYVKKICNLIQTYDKNNNIKVNEYKEFLQFLFDNDNIKININFNHNITKPDILLNQVLNY